MGSGHQSDLDGSVQLEVTVHDTAGDPDDRPECLHLNVELTKVGRSIRRLHALVCSHGKRVEITRSDCDDVCVLISKKELDSLEAALEILSETAGYAGMCEHLKELLIGAGILQTEAVRG